MQANVFHAEYVRPICLATASESSHEGDPVTVTGWGTTSDGKIICKNYCFPYTEKTRMILRNTYICNMIA